MLEEREVVMQTEMVLEQVSNIELVINKLVFKHESVDTTIVQLQGKLVREKAEQSHIVIALHAKDETGQYIHLQQYEFDYIIDATPVKEIDISVLVLSELKQNEKYEIEIKLLTEKNPQQWETAQRYVKKV